MCKGLALPGEWEVIVSRGGFPLGRRECLLTGGFPLCSQGAAADIPQFGTNSEWFVQQST